MSDITLEGIAAVIKEELKPVNERLEKVETKLETIETTQTNHTTALANLSTDVKKVLDEKTVTNNRLEYIETWARQVSQKIGIEFRP